GLAMLLGVAWLLSSNRRRFPWNIVLGGLGLQWALALFVLRTTTGHAVFTTIASLVTAVLDAAAAGAQFVFQMLAGGDAPWFLNVGVIILATITFMSTLAAIGYYLGILQRV